VKEIVTLCPRCNEKLIATKLSCSNCELEINGKFILSKFDYLSEDELEFVESFLRTQGNFKTLQEKNGMSYPAVKKKFNDIINKLNLPTIKNEERNKAIMVATGFQPIGVNDSPVVKRIKEKLNSSNGQALITLYNGDVCLIEYDLNGKGLVSPKIPPANQLTWEVFDATVEVVIQNGGKAIKGKARSGAKLGDDDLPLDSVEGYIAHKVHGVQIGKSAFGPSFVIAAVLDWAEICNNERGYITINQSFKSEIE